MGSQRVRDDWVTKHSTYSFFTEPQTFLFKLVGNQEFWLQVQTNNKGLSLSHLQHQAFGPQALSVYLCIQCISVSVYSVYLGAVTPLQSVRGKKIFPFACDKSLSVTNLSSHIWNSGLISSGRPHGDTFLVMHKTRPNCHPGKAGRRHTPKPHRLDSFARSLWCRCGSLASRLSKNNYELHLLKWVLPQKSPPKITRQCCPEILGRVTQNLP